LPDENQKRNSSFINAIKDFSAAEDIVRGQKNSQQLQDSVILMSSDRNALWLCYIFHGNNKNLALLPTYIQRLPPAVLLPFRHRFPRFCPVFG